MAALHFPSILFKTQKWMDDYGASDMASYKPFMSNMDAFIEISGRRNEP